MNVLKIPLSELNLKAVLLNGQSFRWRSIEDAFYGVVEGLLLYIRRLDNEQLEWRCLGRAPRSENIDVATKIHKYFQLEVSLAELWKDWCNRDPFMTQLKDVKELHGIRILKQEPLETLLAFICSANNNIPRISSMVNKLAKLYGDPIVLDSPTQSCHVLEHFPELGYAFPTLSQLAAVQDELTAVLREQQFGYRANYVSGTVRQLNDMTSDILFDVQTLPCDEIRKFLRGFSGVGPKVAECVALMSLGQNQCVPVDRHVFKITKKYFLPALKDSSLTDALNRHIMEFYEEKFGAYAGWVQAVLFNQQLEKFVHTPSITKQVKQKESAVKTKSQGKQKKIVKKISSRKSRKDESCGIPLKSS
ncbi:8-oxoguanine DNA-glycosylase [Ancylostoma duodenale]|uniref:DNA-(apurinic or apyrimidinic site) lyase n=1 Tax=Ancylostoma duodenale TaxID=51022 RepID=A0A0C2GYF2_9BILA|nr:8-oxoguanine DNA-glycosylase [Ancylostoma duodenale]